MKWNKAIIFLLFVLGIGLFTPFNQVEAKGSPTYTISPNSNTYDGKFLNYSTLNTKTKHYYLIRSYLERLEETGGGTLVLNKGTYTVTNTLYVPSNVTIKLKNGAKIIKGKDSGTNQFGASKSIFQFVRPSLSGKSGVYGGYSGEKNISIIGEGQATIDLNHDKDALAVVAGHNQNIKIENIDFRNMYSGHFIEIDATKDAVIRNNTFMNSKASSGLNKEAINIDTPDKSTLGWSQKWSTFDKTPNKHMIIENNHFYNLDRAIGTHKYSSEKYHDEMIIRNNTIEKMRSDAIRVMNWSNSIIENNTIRNVHPSSANNNRGILVSGAINPTFKNNIFIDMPRAMQFMVWKNSGGGSEYPITYNELSSKNIDDLKTNTIIGYEEDFIRINHEYNKFDREHTDYVPIKTGIFADFFEHHSGYEEAIQLVDQGIIRGYDDYTFRPYQSISREHVAVLLYNALDLKEPRNKKEILSTYQDVNVDHRYATQIAAVTAEGIFGGANGYFKPSNDISRSQMATVLVGAFDLKETGEPVELIDLEDINSSHRQNVKILAQNNITIGKLNSHNERYFDGRGDLYRSQFAIFLKKAMDIK